MATIRISVKGDEGQAREAMAARGVAGVLADGRRGRTFWDVPEAQRPVLIAWFCEPAVCSQGDGFPAGTLLHHF